MAPMTEPAVQVEIPCLSLVSHPPAAADDDFTAGAAMAARPAAVIVNGVVTGPALPDIVPEELHLGTPPTSPSSTVSWDSGLLLYPVNPFASPSPAAATSPTPTSQHSADGGDQAPLHFTVVLAILGVVAAILATIVAEFRDTVGGWSTAPEVVYGILTVLTMALLAAGIAAAVRYAASVPRSRTMLSASALCAKLGTVLSIALLAVAITCKLGKWGCVAGVPSAVVIACPMAAVWVSWNELAASCSVCRKIQEAVISVCRKLRKAVCNFWRRVMQGVRRGDSLLPVTTNQGSN